MRIVFMGSAELAVPSLDAILKAGKDELVGVVSQPDRPAGRKRKPTPCPLKAFAEENGLNIMTPEKVGVSESIDALAALKPDLFVVVAYGQYIPSRIINLAPHEAINVHPSLLPKYRGSAPIQWAIANGDRVTGVSIIYLAKKMDAGDVLRQETYPIGADESSGTLHDKLAVFGSELLLGAIDDARVARRTFEDLLQKAGNPDTLEYDAGLDFSLCQHGRQRIIQVDTRRYSEFFPLFVGRMVGGVQDHVCTHLLRHRSTHG